MELILQPWPWYISGPLLAIVMYLLVYFGQTFGVSSNLRTLCTIGGAARYSDFFRFEWKSQLWNLMVVLGAVLGGGIAYFLLSDHAVIELNSATIVQLHEFGFKNIGESLVPMEVFGLESIYSLKGIALLTIGGFLVGFGTRYAGGCTSGHAITGLSNLQLPSLIAVVGFFIGGLLMTHLILPLLF